MHIACASIHHSKKLLRFFVINAIAAINCACVRKVLREHFLIEIAQLKSTTRHGHNNNTYHKSRRRRTTKLSPSKTVSPPDCQLNGWSFVIIQNF